jgi:hypothetical protein
MIVAAVIAEKAKDKFIATLPGNKLTKEESNNLINYCDKETIRLVKGLYYGAWKVDDPYDKTYYRCNRCGRKSPIKVESTMEQTKCLTCTRRKK